MNIPSLIKIGFLSQLVLIFALSINTTSAAKLYKWVDDKGRISYQDKPPPANSKILSEKTLEDRSVAKANKASSRNAKPIDVYVTKSCPGCDNVLEQLKDWGVPYTENAIEDHRNIQTRLLELTEGINVPALFYDNKYLSNTSTTEGLRENLEETGHLKVEASTETDKTAQEPKKNEVPKVSRNRDPIVIDGAH